jgi:V8-like Glu-specific endopeptidase
MLIKQAIGAFLLLAFSFSPLSIEGQRRTAPRTQQVPSAADVAAAAMRSVVSIITLDAMGQPQASGSGFFIESGTVLTSYHVVKNAQRILVSHISGERTQVTATLTWRDETRDLAILKPRGIVGTPLKAAAAKHRVGDKVYVIGNPEGLAGTFSEGIISAFRALDGTSYVQITAPISHGSSGGPVLDESGRVIGIATAFIRDAQNLNLAVELNDGDLVYLPSVVSDAGKARERGTAILEAALVAKGRRQTSEGVRDYMLRLQVAEIIQGQETNHEEIIQCLLPNKLRIEWVPSRGQRSVMALNGDTAWTQQGGRIVDLPPQFIRRMEEAINHENAVLFLKLPNGSTVEPLPDENVNGQPADVLLATGPEDFSMMLFLDKSTHLLLRSAYDTLDLPTGEKRRGQEVYSDYKQTNGFWIPFKTVRFLDGVRSAERSLTEFKLNLGLDASISDTPQSTPTQNNPTQSTSAAEAPSSDAWQFIVANSTIKYYGRKKDIQVLSDGHRSAWIKMLPARPGTFGDNLASLSGNREAVMRTEFDCAGLRTKYLWLVTYPEPGMPNSRAMPDIGWFDIIPDSTDAAVAKYVCQ